MPNAKQIAKVGSTSYWLLGDQVYRLNEYEPVRFDTRGLPLGARWECDKAQFDRFKNVILGQGKDAEDFKPGDVIRVRTQLGRNGKEKLAEVLSVATTLTVRYLESGFVDRVERSYVLGKATDAIQHIAVEPVRGGYQTRVMHGENTAQRQGFSSKRQAQRYGERTLAKLAKQAEAAPKFRTWKIGQQQIEHVACPACKQSIAVVEGKIAPHTRPWLYGVQKNFKVDPTNKRYACKGSNQLAPVPVTDMAKLVVKQGRSGNWAVFKEGEDFPESEWFASKSKATAELNRLGGKPAKKLNTEQQAREIARRTELNPTVRAYFKLDDE
jgi:hypothetical protein